MDTPTLQGATGARSAATATGKAAKAEPSAEASAGSALASDFDTFLKMLTTQMTNQDPLAPMKSEEFAVQLATFSGVEQQVRTNELLSRLAEQSGASGGLGLSNLSGWIGREVRAPMAVRYDGVTPVTVPVDDAPIAGDSHAMIVRGRDGSIVDRRAVSVFPGDVTWDGRTANGRSVPAGVYEFVLESRDADGVVATEVLSPYARVTEARVGGEGPVLVFDGGVEVDVAEATALREAAAG